MGKPLVVCEYCYCTTVCFHPNIPAEAGGGYAHRLRLEFVLQDASRLEVDRREVVMDLATTPAMLSAEVAVAMACSPETAAVIARAIAEAKAEWAGYVPAPAPEA